MCPIIALRRLNLDLGVQPGKKPAVRHASTLPRVKSGRLRLPDRKQRFAADAADTMGSTPEVFAALPQLRAESTASLLTRLRDKMAVNIDDRYTPDLLDPAQRWRRELPQSRSRVGHWRLVKLLNNVWYARVPPHHRRRSTTIAAVEIIHARSATICFDAN
jgi:hypothetical protein